MQTDTIAIDAKPETLKKPASDKPDVIRLSEQFKIVNISLPDSGKDNKWYNFDVLPNNYLRSEEWQENHPEFDSKIRFMNERQYKEVFGELNPQDIRGKLINLTFAIPSRWYEHNLECSHKIDRFEKKEIYSPEFKCSWDKFTVVSIVPNCGLIHVAKSSYMQTHYNLKMLFEERKFDELRSFFNTRKGKYSDKGFPKRDIPLELRQFDLVS